MSYDFNAPLNTVVKVINDLVGFNTDIFTADGMWLIGGLFVIAMGWAGIRIIIEADNQTSAMAGMTKAVIVAGLAVAILGGGHSMGKNLSENFNVMTDRIFAVGGGGDFKGKGAGELVAEVMRRMSIASFKVMTGKGSNDKDEPLPEGSMAEKAANLLKGFFTESPLATVFSFLITILFRIFIALFIIVAGLIYCGQLVVSQIMVVISLAMMPLMVPWMILDSTAFIFNGWLKFTIIAGLAKVVGALLFSATYQAIDNAINIANGAFDTGDLYSLYMAYSTTFLIVGIMAMLMLQITSIASGLVTGHGGGSWSPSGKMAPGGAATAASKPIQQAGGKAAGAAGSIASTVAGAAVGGAVGAIGGGARGGIGGLKKEGREGLNAGGKLGVSGALAAGKGGIDSGKGASAGIRNAASAKVASATAAKDAAPSALRQAYRDGKA